MGLSFQGGRDSSGRLRPKARRDLDVSSPSSFEGGMCGSTGCTAPAPLRGGQWRAYGSLLTEVSAMAPPPLVGMV